MRFDRENTIGYFALIAGVAILYFVIFRVIRKRAKSEERFFTRLLQQHIYRAGFLFLMCVTMLSGFGLLRRYIKDDLFFAIRHALWIAVIIALGLLIIRALTVLREMAFRKYNENAVGDVRVRKVRTQFQLIQRIANGLVITGMIVGILMTFPKVREMGTALLASAGVVGIILGFAAQKSLGTFFGGIQIAIAQPIRIGDVVVVEKEFGEIGEINLTFVTVYTWDGRRLIVPINYFLENAFENWTRLTPEVIGKVKIRVDYTFPVDALRTHFNSLLEENKLWDRRKSGLLVTGTDETTMEIRMTMSARDSGDAWDLECYIREKVIAFVQENYPDALPKRRIVIDTGEQNSSFS